LEKSASGDDPRNTINGKGRMPKTAAN